MKQYLVPIVAAAGAAIMGATSASGGSSFFSISFSTIGSCSSWGGTYVSRPVFAGCRPARYVRYRPSYVWGPSTYRVRSYCRPVYSAPVVCRPVRPRCATPVVTSCRPRYVKARRVATPCAEPRVRSGRPVRLPAYARAQSPCAYAVMPGGTPVAKFAGRF